VIDQDTRAVIDRLDAAVAASGLSLRRFAHALGTSPSRLSSYRTGRVAPSAAFLLRAERIAGALRQARRDSVPTILDAVKAIRSADGKGDDDWTYALALEARDRLRDVLLHHRSHAAIWEIQPPANLADRWKTLIAAFVFHEFTKAGLPAPPWTEGVRLSAEWVLHTPRVSETEIKGQTPDWLAERNIFIAEKDLVTL
jgi:transcriptional regulator with XRE-family HTH domain